MSFIWPDHEDYRQRFDVIREILYGKKVLEALVEIGQSSSRVLDLGCGCGWLSRYLAQRIPHATIDAIDEDRELISVAEGQESEDGEGRAKINYECTRFPGEFLAKNEGLYDLVVLSFTALRQEESLLFMDEVKKMLKPDGKIFYYDCIAVSEKSLQFLSRLHGWYLRTRGIRVDPWNHQRHLQHYYQENEIRKEIELDDREMELFRSHLGEMFEIEDCGEQRAFCDLWIGEEIGYFWGKTVLPLMRWLDDLVIAQGWMDGQCEYLLLSAKD